MRKPILTIALLLLGAGPTLAQKIFVDYDGATAFSQYRTFQFRETKEDLRDTSPGIHRNLVDALKQYAVDGGLEEVDTDPDVYVAYYTADRRHLRLALTDLGYSYGPDFSLGEYWQGGVGTRKPDDFTFQQGTLVIDIWDREEERLIWRGIATATVSDKPEKNAKKVDKALKKIIKEWEKDYGGYVRRLRKYQESQEEDT